MPRRVGSSLVKARAAKKKVEQRLRSLPQLNGIGITRVGDGYGVKVNVSAHPRPGAVPSEVNGVPVRLEVVGTIRPRRIA